MIFQSFRNYVRGYKNPCWFTNQVQSLDTIRCMPYVYALGVGKSGSTTMCRYLQLHQDVILPLKKELAFWDGGTKGNQSKNHYNETLEKLFLLICKTLTLQNEEVLFRDD